MSNTCNNYTTTGSCGYAPAGQVAGQSCSCTQIAGQSGSCTQVAGAAQGGENCNCRDAFATALRLLCSGDLAGLVDYNAFAFIGSDYLIGTYATCTCQQTGSFDNLADVLSGSFNRFTPCSCDLIDISGIVYNATPSADPTALPELFTVLSDNLDGVAGAEGVVSALAAFADRLTPTSANFRPELLAAFNPLLGGCPCGELSVDEVSLCALCAIAFEAAGVEGPLQDANYQTLKQVLMQMLRPAAPTCPPCTPPTPQPCTIPANCNAGGLLASLDRCGMVQSVSLTAGPLLLANVTLLGAIGDVLILANDDDNRIYFVCSDCVEFVG